jgi:hypothetical protein
VFVFLPYLDTHPGLAIFAQEVAVPLMENCSSHASDHVIPILTEARVQVISFAPHTPQVFLVLDLTVFGVLKRRPRCALTFDDDDATVTLIMK